MPTPTPEPGTLALVSTLCLLTCMWWRFWSRLAALIATIALLSTGLARADVYNLPAGQTSLQFVSVGDAGNLADSASHSGVGSSNAPGTGSGTVNYNYNMGKYDVTLGQYCQFLNAVAATHHYGLYNSNMAGAGRLFHFGIEQMNE